MKTYAYGFPRLGRNREYKKTIERFWKNELSEPQVKQALDTLQKDMLETYTRHVDSFPVGEMTGYDPILDMAIMVGLYRPQNLSEYYELCRGRNALEMTKWFNTNYHYLVPHFSQLNELKFSLHWNKPQEAYDKFQMGIPYMIGPFTLLKLSKGLSPRIFGEVLMSLSSVYKKILMGLTDVHMDEPAFVLDLSPREINAIQKVYANLGEAGARIHLFTYYDSVDFLKDLYRLPLASIGLDFVHGKGNYELIRQLGFPEDKTLIAGVIDGRNVWKTDIQKTVALLEELAKKAKSLRVSNAAPLYHLPLSVQGEKLDPQLLKVLAFAEEKLKEIRLLAEASTGPKISSSISLDRLGKNDEVLRHIAALKEDDFIKKVPCAERRRMHQKLLDLPLFPSTTIGSFPQTAEVRKIRADYRSGLISEAQYKGFVRQKIKELIRLQEELGLDVLVHGEFERTDMVEFFAEKLEGIATTQNGWIISYGTRMYRPPIIYGDVRRPGPMTIDEIAYAQSLTPKPVKGMLTGPVTIIAWSYVREDIPIAEVAYQIALALRAEIRDYEKKGIRIVQIDEPAVRERAPIKRRDWPAYFDWAIKAFRLSSNTDSRTQIHTHMCYSEFGEIVEMIDQMDFDVISIETTRSRGDIIASFERIDFKKQIGLGVWDIHSPVVPPKEKMKEVVERALKIIPKENFWINPDCGLKTRGWEESRASLKNLVELSHELRQMV